MFLRICQSKLPQISLLKSSGFSRNVQIFRSLSNDGKQSFTRTARSRETITEKISKPSIGTGSYIFILYFMNSL